MNDDIHSGEVDQRPDRVGAIYCRVSTIKQAEEGDSLESQETSLSKEAKRRNVSIVDVVKDAGVSGADFERDGLRKIRRLAKTENLSHVFVDSVDRIGRDTVMTLYYLYKLRKEYGTTIITSDFGELDVTKHSDLICIVLLALSSQSSRETGVRKSVRGRADNFKRKQWFSAFPTIPFGYVKNEKDEWLSRNPKEVGVFQEAVANFLQADPARAYQETIDKTPSLPPEIDAQKLGQLLRRPLYKGAPTTNYGRTLLDINSSVPTTVEDESLRIISDETYGKVQEKIAEVGEVYGGKRELTSDIPSLAHEFGIEKLLTTTPLLRLVCPQCGGRMTKSGPRKVRSRHGYNYKCAECGKNRQFPKQGELDYLTGRDAESAED